jgi:hypothetical protein
MGQLRILLDTERLLAPPIQLNLIRLEDHHMPERLHLLEERSHSHLKAWRFKR